jgi:hypothetical protein
MCLVAEAPWRFTNGCILCPKVDVGTNQFAGTIEITPNIGSQRPNGATLSIGKEWLQQFGQVHQGIGDVAMTAWADPAAMNRLPRLLVKPPNPNTKTDFGVSVALDKSRCISGILDYDMVAFPWHSTLIIGTNHISDHTTITANAAGAAANISFGFDLSGAETGRLDFLNQGTLTGSMNVTTGTVLTASSLPLRMAGSTSSNTPAGTAGFGLYWQDAAIIIVAMPTGGGQFQADELRITPVNPRSPLPWLTHCDVVSGGLSALELMAEDVRPSVMGPLSINRQDSQVRLSYPTEPGRPYQLEYAPVLPSPVWSVLETYMGDGSVRIFLEQIQTRENRFYRLSGR